MSQNFIGRIGEREIKIFSLVLLVSGSFALGVFTDDIVSHKELEDYIDLFTRIDVTSINATELDRAEYSCPVNDFVEVEPEIYLYNLTSVILHEIRVMIDRDDWKMIKIYSFSFSLFVVSFRLVDDFPSSVSRISVSYFGRETYIDGVTSGGGTYGGSGSVDETGIKFDDSS